MRKKMGIAIIAVLAASTTMFGFNTDHCYVDFINMTPDSVNVHSHWGDLDSHGSTVFTRNDVSFNIPAGGFAGFDIYPNDDASGRDLLIFSLAVNGGASTENYLEVWVKGFLHDNGNICRDVLESYCVANTGVAPSGGPSPYGFAVSPSINANYTTANTNGYVPLAYPDEELSSYPISLSAEVVSLSGSATLSSKTIKSVK